MDETKTKNTKIIINTIFAILLIAIVVAFIYFYQFKKNKQEEGVKETQNIITERMNILATLEVSTSTAEERLDTLSKLESGDTKSESELLEDLGKLLP